MGREELASGLNPWRWQPGGVVEQVDGGTEREVEPFPEAMRKV
jgi:hypothetical protein